MNHALRTDQSHPQSHDHKAADRHREFCRQRGRTVTSGNALRTAYMSAPRGRNGREVVSFGRPRRQPPEAGHGPTCTRGMPDPTSLKRCPTWSGVIIRRRRSPSPRPPSANSTLKDELVPFALTHRAVNQPHKLGKSEMALLRHRPHDYGGYVLTTMGNARERHHDPINPLRQHHVMRIVDIGALGFQRRDDGLRRSHRRHD